MISIRLERDYTDCGRSETLNSKYTYRVNTITAVGKNQHIFSYTFLCEILKRRHKLDIMRTKYVHRRHHRYVNQWTALIFDRLIE